MNNSNFEIEQEAKRKELESLGRKAQEAYQLEREAIDEVIREQFSKQIAERVAQKKAELEKKRKG
jgi:hypothetical protein